MALFTISYYTPITPRFIFHAGLVIPGLTYLLWRPALLKEFLQIFSWLLIPLMAIQLLNYSVLLELKVWFYLLGLIAACVLVDRSSVGMRNVFLFFAVASVLTLLYLTGYWVWLKYSTHAWVRLGEGQVIMTGPIEAGLLVGSGMVAGWIFAVEPWLKRCSQKYVLIGFIGLTMLIMLAALVFQCRSLLLGYGFYVFFYALRNRLGWVVILALVTVLLAVWLTGADQILAQRGLSYRPQIWADAWQRVSQDCGLLIGCGKDGYRFLGMYSHAHNMLVQLLYEDGLIGCIMLMVFMGYIGLKCWRSDWLLIALVGIGGQMTNTGWMLSSPKAYWIYFWLPLIMVLIENQKMALDRYFEKRTVNRSQWFEIGFGKKK